LSFRRPLVDFIQLNSAFDQIKLNAGALAKFVGAN